MKGEFRNPRNSPRSGFHLRNKVVVQKADYSESQKEYDRHDEEIAVAAFAKSLRLAADEYLSDPLGLPLIPNWNRVIAAVPDFFDRLTVAVETDHRVPQEVPV